MIISDNPEPIKPIAQNFFFPSFTTRFFVTSIPIIDITDGSAMQTEIKSGLPK